MSTRAVGARHPLSIRHPANRKFGDIRTTSVQDTSFTDAASAQCLERAAAALTAHGFTVEILDAAAARTRVKELIPEGATVFTGASETLRLSGIDDDLNGSGRYDSVKARTRTMNRATQLAEIWRMLACPGVIVGSVAAVTETGSLVAASASGSQLAGYSGAAARASGSSGRRRWYPTWAPRCGASKTTAFRWKTSVP
jgi:hypothetical protein